MISKLTLQLFLAQCSHKIPNFVFLVVAAYEFQNIACGIEQRRCIWTAFQLVKSLRRLGFVFIEIASDCATADIAADV